MWALGFMPTPLPNTPGYDVSGVIEAILPDGETDFVVGDEVFGCHWGTHTHTDEYGYTAGSFAEFMIIPIRNLAKKPENITHEQAAANAMVTMTALIPNDLAKVTNGTKVLILGGSTAVGSLAIQIAKSRGFVINFEISVSN